jgi:hypothetical protein
MYVREAIAGNYNTISEIFTHLSYYDDDVKIAVDGNPNTPPFIKLLI